MYAVLILQIPMRDATTASDSDSPRNKTFSVYRWVSLLSNIIIQLCFSKRHSHKFQAVTVRERDKANGINKKSEFPTGVISSLIGDSDFF